MFEFECNCTLISNNFFVCFRQFKDENIISIKLSPETDEPSSESLHVIKFSIHPTFSDIHNIVNIAAPLSINAIGYSIDIPFDLSYMCRYDENDSKENRIL